MMRVSLRTSETEDQAERLVDGSELARTKASRRSAEALRVHHSLCVSGLRVDLSLRG